MLMPDTTLTALDAMLPRAPKWNEARTRSKTGQAERRK